MMRNGFHLLLEEQEMTSNKSMRYHERCYICGQKCKSTGRSVPTAGRVCGSCYDTIIMEGVKALLEVIENKPAFTIEGVQAYFSGE